MNLAQIYQSFILSLLLSYICFLYWLMQTHMLFLQFAIASWYFFATLYINNMMHSQLPPVSLNLDSYLPSPKYRQESTLVASPQKNRVISNDSSFISPSKEPIPKTNRSLSSLILTASPVKTAPQNQKA